jgi:hypothetical protein
MAMNKPGGTKARGRTKIQGSGAPIDGNRGAVKQTKRTEATRPIGNGGGKNRGDRRDTNPTYTGNNRRQPNNANPAGRAGERRTHGRGR